MKRLFLSTLVACSALMLMSGCVFSIGSSQSKTDNHTVGQQLIDLQHAKDSGAITEAEFEVQKAKILDKK
jgi:Short C-terminal domain